MSMFPHTVTVYSVYETHDAELHETQKNYIAVLKGVLLEASKAINVNKSGLEGADAVTLYIPWNVDAKDGITGEKITYMPPVEFNNQEDSRNGHWTLNAALNCFFVKGEVVHEDWDRMKIESACDDVYSVTKVDLLDFGGHMMHWRVGGN